MTAHVPVASPRPETYPVLGRDGQSQRGASQRARAGDGGASPSLASRGHLQPERPFFLRLLPSRDARPAGRR
ncbi:hypothetical protein CDD83_2518 [Cordyceps sp. RAO-2017]|nr:hypothetical protein CDD83_2518 [Cordyceps sp. RAO-2017]